MHCWMISGRWDKCLVAAFASGLLMSGCGSFAFYEDSKIAIAIKVDPKAPDPVELSAAFKESVFALIPIGEVSSQTPPRLTVGPVLSDFDVRYGVNAGANNSRNQDFLYAAITHGVATGEPARILARQQLDSDSARRVVILAFLRQLDVSKLGMAADALKLGGLGKPDEAVLRGRLAAAVIGTPRKDLDAL